MTTIGTRLRNLERLNSPDSLIVWIDRFAFQDQDVEGVAVQRGHEQQLIAPLDGESLDHLRERALASISARPGQWVARFRRRGSDV